MAVATAGGSETGVKYTAEVNATIADGEKPQAVVDTKAKTEKMSQE